MAFTPTQPNSQYGTVLSTTLRNVARGISDNVTNSLILFHWLNSKGHKRTYDGGQSIQVPIMLGLNTTAGSYRGYDVGDASPQEGVTSAIYPWRQLRVYIAISGIEMFQNSGPWAVTELIGTKVEQAVISLQDELNREAYADGTGNDYKDILGLKAIVETVPGTTSIGLVSTNNTEWQNQAESFSGITSGTAYRADLRKLYNNCSKGRDHPTVILSNQESYEQYEATLVKDERYMNSDTVSGDFTGLMFKTAPWFFDEDIEPAAGDGTIYMLNHKHLWWAVARGVDFSASDFYMSPNQDAYTSCIKCYGNLITDNRRMHGVGFDVPLSGIDPNT